MNKRKTRRHKRTRRKGRSRRGGSAVTIDAIVTAGTGLFSQAASKCSIKPLNPADKKIARKIFVAAMKWLDGNEATVAKALKIISERMKTDSQYRDGVMEVIAACKTQDGGENKADRHIIRIGQDGTQYDYGNWDDDDDFWAAAHDAAFHHQPDGPALYPMNLVDGEIRHPHILGFPAGRFLVVCVFAAIGVQVLENEVGTNTTIGGHSAAAIAFVLAALFSAWFDRWMSGRLNRTLGWDYGHPTHGGGARRSS